MFGFLFLFYRVCVCAYLVKRSDQAEEVVIVNKYVYQNEDVFLREYLKVLFQAMRHSVH